MEDQNTPVILKILPPELHLLLGTTQHLVDELAKVWTEITAWQLHAVNTCQTNRLLKRIFRRGRLQKNLKKDR